MKMKHIVLLVVVLETTKIDFVKPKCIASVPTIRYVSSCPSDEESWKEAELKKNCEGLAKIQKCVEDPSKFKYHCLVNSYVNATLEVCAPTRFISGYCADFNTLQIRVTENYNIDCTKLKPACPRRYVSTEIYKYPGCYTLKENYNNIDNSTLSTEYSILQLSSTSTFVYNKLETRSTNAAIIVMGAVLAIIIFICISFVGYKLRKRFIFHQISKNPLDDPDVMRSLCTEDVEMRRGIYLTDTDDEEEELEEEVEDVGNKYYPLVPKDRSNLTEEDKYNNEEATELLITSNEESTKNFLANAKAADSFYEETKVYKKIENVLRTNSVVILTGPPGFGKTQTAIHLMMPFREDWAIRKVENYFELNYIECAKNTVIFIDNIFYGKSNEFAEWMKPLEKLNKLLRSMDRNRKKSEENKRGEIKVIITAKSDIIEEACELMRKRSIFREDCIVNLSEEQYELENGEKKRILLKQIEFAKQEKGIESPNLTDLFWEKVTKSKAHIGFPLCAHLFAFEEAFRRKGEDFFSWPTQLVLTQIEDVVKNDKTNRIKTLFLFLLLLETHNRNKDQESKFKADLKNNKDCASDFLKKTCRLGDHFRPLNFKNLPTVASELTWSFIRKTGENSYEFIHQSVFDAVESYTFRSFPIKSIALLPFDVIERQTNDKESLTWLKDEHFRYLAKRFITEIKCGRSSHICECEILKRTEFIQNFCDAVSNLDNRDLIEFFTSKSLAFPHLPILFWLGRSESIQLLKKLISIIESSKNEKLNAVEHIYYSLFGECTKGENLKSLVCLTGDKSRDDIKNCVMSFRDNINNTILHIVIQSTREDDFATKIVKQLIKDDVDINAKNRYRKTPLMLAVKVTWPLSRRHVVEELVQHNCEVQSKDRSDNSVFHHCVHSDTEHDDFTCANIIDILLRTTERVDLSIDNTNGLTALNLACKNTKHSRILSMCSILAYSDSSEQKDNKHSEVTQSSEHGKKNAGDVRNSSEHVDKIDSEGKNPIFNAVSCLTGENELVEMERLLRVCILLLYGADPHIKSDDADRSAITFCKEKGYSDLEAIMAPISNASKTDKQKTTEYLMIEALKKGLKRLSKTHAIGDHLKIKMKLSNKIQISEEMTELLSNAVQYLAKTQFNISPEN